MSSIIKKTVPVILSTLVLISCKTESEKDYMILSGEIDALDIGGLDIGVYRFDFEKEIPVDQEGRFSDTLKINDGFYTFFGIDLYGIDLYLTRSEDLHISLDNIDGKTVFTFKGANAGINSYLEERRNLSNTLMGGSPYNLYKLSEERFLLKMKEVRDSLINLAKASGLGDELLTRELKRIDHYYLEVIHNIEVVENLPSIEDLQSLPNRKSKDFKFSRDSLEVTEEDVDIDDELSYRDSQHFQARVWETIDKLTVESLPEEDSHSKSVYYDNALRIINKEITNPIIKNDLLYVFVTDAGDDGLLMNLYKDFMTFSTSEKHKTEITELYNKLAMTAEGKPSPKFVNYRNAKGGVSSLDDLKGKYVYIDVWATWCGPCIAQIPYLKEIEEKYHDKNIAFVSISIDQAEDYDKWKGMVESKDLGGIQLFADNAGDSYFVEAYHIEGIPRFILIDPEGRIVSSNAPKPSNPELIELLEGLAM